jgi:DNA uptake protein ComE-like DNA-binding protein
LRFKKQEGTHEKAELEKSRMHRDALENQIKNLKGSNEKMSRDLEVLTSEVQRIKEGCQNEKALLESREKEFNQEKQLLVAKLRTLTGEYRKLKGQSKALKDTVIRYQKELKEARQKKAANLSSQGKPRLSSPPPQKARPQTSRRAVPANPRPKAPPKVVAKVAPKKETVALVNINTATVNDLVLFLGLTKDMAQDVVDNRPYRLRGELVAKQVVPKATFDVIKDRITSAQ